MSRLKNFFVGIVVSILMFTLAVPPASAATLAELQAQIATLLAQIASLNNSASQSTGGFSVGDSVVTTAAVRVRTSGSITGQLVGIQPINVSGKVQAGPTVAGGYSWYRVDFASGADGWVAANWLKKSETNTTKLDVNTFVKTSIGSDNEMEPGLEDASIVEIVVLPASYDRYANKVVLQFTPASDNAEDLPWVAFDELTLWANGWNIMSINAGDLSKWRKVGNGYEITVFSGNEKISPNRSYNFILAVTSDEDVPVGDRWTVSVPAQGVVIWSQTNGHMTNAAPMTAYPIEFVSRDDEEDVVLYTDALDMNVTTEGENDERGDFTLEFELTALDDDIYIKNNATRSLKDGGVIYRVDGPSEDKVSAQLTSSAGAEGGYYVINQGETENFEVNVWVDATVSGTYRVVLESIRYSFGPSAETDTYQFTPAENYRTSNVALMGGSTSTAKPICEIMTDKSAYKLGENIKISWTSKNATYAYFKKDTSGKDNLLLPGDKLGVSGSQVVKATVLGNPTITLVAVGAAGTAECLVKVAISKSSVPPATSTSTGTYIGYMNGNKFIETKNITEKAALENCKLNASKNPTASIRCTWNGKEIYKTEPESVLGTYIGYIDGRKFIETKNISKTAALENCKKNATNNPNTVVHCTWNGVEIYRSEKKVIPSTAETTSKPTCDAFTASPRKITVGDNTTLTWKTTNANKVVLTRPSGNTTEHAANGSVTVKPNKTHTFELTVRGTGGTTKCSVTVNVAQIPVAPTAGEVRGATIDVYAQMASILEAASAILRTLEVRQ